MSALINENDIVKQHSELIKILRLYPSLDKTKIAEKLGVSTPTVYKFLDELRKKEIINEDLSINPVWGTFVGISIGTSLCKVAFLHFDFSQYTINDFETYKTEMYCMMGDDDSDSGNYVCFETPNSFSDLKNRLNSIFVVIQKHIDAGDLKIISVGISSTGTVDERVRKICQAHNLSYLNGRTIDQMLFDDMKKYFDNKGIPLFFVQNSKASVIAETFNLYDNNIDPDLQIKKNIVALYFEFGVGAGFVINGKLYDGNGYAGEIGHIPASIDMQKYKETDSSQKNCTCGSSVCIDHIIRSCVFDDLLPNFHSSDFRNMSSDDISSFLNDNPGRAECLGDVLGYIVKLLANVLNIDLVIFTGKLYKSEQVLKKYIQKTMDENNLEFNRNDCRIRTSKIGTLAPAIGAAIYSYYKKCNIELEWT